MPKLLIPTTSGIRTVSITRWKVSIFAFLTLAFSATGMYLTLNVFAPWLMQQKVEKLRAENKQMLSRAEQLRARVDIVKWRLSLVQSSDEALRTYNEVPNLSGDVRKLGIGGIRYDKTIQLDYLLPESDVSLSQLRIDIDRLTRLTKLEQLSYEKLDKTVKVRIGKIKATPSIRPVTTGHISDGFGYRSDPFTHRRRFHYGLDISTSRGTPIYAAADGVVNYAKRNGGYGLMVSINHGYGYETLYGHMSKLEVKRGQRVNRGDEIGKVGNTGRSTGSHLHYEVQLRGKPVNPYSYYFTGQLNH